MSFSSQKAPTFYDIPPFFAASFIAKNLLLWEKKKFLFVQGIFVKFSFQSSLWFKSMMISSFFSKKVLKLDIFDGVMLNCLVVSTPSTTKSMKLQITKFGASHLFLISTPHLTFDLNQHIWSYEPLI